MRMRHLKKPLVAFSMAAILFITPNVAQAAAKACPTGSQVQGSSQNQVLGGLGQTTSDCSGDQAGTAIGSIAVILSWVAGLLGVIMVIVSGFKYVTAGGDSSKVSSARSTLVYAVVGLVIAALAQFLVHFVINTAHNAATFDNTKATLAAGNHLTVQWKGGVGPYRVMHGNTLVCTAPAKTTSCSGVVSNNPPREVQIIDSTNTITSVKY